MYSDATCINPYQRPLSKCAHKGALCKKSLEYFGEYSCCLRCTKLQKLQTLCQNCHEISSIAKTTACSYCGAIRSLKQPQICDANAHFPHDCVSNICTRPCKKFARNVASAMESTCVHPLGLCIFSTFDNLPTFMYVCVVD